MTKNTKDIKEPTLDPDDWSKFRTMAHQVLDISIDRLENAKDHPWKPVPSKIKQRFSNNDIPMSGTPLSEIIDEIQTDIFPYATGNTHPAFFGWVHGTGLADSLIAAIFEAAMNSNCGGRDHIAPYVEQQVIEWCRTMFGFPEGTGGLLVSGTSMATMLAMVVARNKTIDKRHQGTEKVKQRKLIAYTSKGGHSAISKSLNIVGGGSQQLRRIAVHEDHSMDLQALEAAIVLDKSSGAEPFFVVATLGGVNTGASDDLQSIAKLCAAHDIWLHVDGAFGVWTKCADAPWNTAAYGLEQADSMAFDFHKWPSVNYDCGCLLVRDGDQHRRAFTERPEYLRSSKEGLAGGDPWYCDYGLELSRSFRALKVWMALKTHGFDGFGKIVSKNCQQTLLLAELIEREDGFELCFKPTLNICCFQALSHAATIEALDQLNQDLASALQLKGIAVFSTTLINDRCVLRAAIVNHRCSNADIENAVKGLRTERLKLIEGKSL